MTARRAAAPRAADPMIGAHMSIAGGLHNAILEAARYRSRALQIFSRNSNQWTAKPLTDEAVETWKRTWAEHPMEVMVHDSYLINLASPDPALYERSRRAFLDEALRCDLLGIPSLVFHPGAHMGAGEEAGLQRIAAALDWTDRELGDRPVRLLAENTAGQGTNLGWRLEHLARLLELVENKDRLRFCIDTCHLLAGGYDFRDEEGYRRVFDEAVALLGAERIAGFHLNDSKKDLGSRVDRHEHIGKGCVGSKAFRFLLADPRFVHVPKVLETPKTDSMDRRNLALLRRLAASG